MIDKVEFEHAHTEDNSVKVDLAAINDSAGGSSPGRTGTATYRDATLLTPYDEEAYADVKTKIAIGANQFSKDWKPQTLPLPGLIHQLTHHEVGKKDGVAIVFGDMIRGRRQKKAIKSCTAIGLDIDTGTPSAEVDAAIKKLNCLALRYTTHSHNKRSTELNKDKILRFGGPDCEIDTDLIRDYIRQKLFWHESIIKTVEFVEDDHTEAGVVCRISHAPMPKHRVVVFLANPFVIANEGRTQQEAMAKWAKVPEALAAKLGVPFDKSCTDPSRLYYLPRHDKGRDFEITLSGGPLFDYTSLNLDGQFDALSREFSKSGSKSKTAEGKELGRWFKKYAHGFQIMDVIEEFAPDRIRTKASSGFNIECPFDEDHSNPGDSNDQACFAVNAADGSNEFFVVKCQHETCKDKTTLDMLGRMIKDEWFGAKVLEDPQYNIAEIDDEEESEGYTALVKEIAKLIFPALPRDIKRIVERMRTIKDEIERETLVGKLKKKSTTRIDTLRKMATPETEDPQPHREANGRMIFEHTDKPDAIDLTDAFNSQIGFWNGTDGAATGRPVMPYLTCLVDEPFGLRTAQKLTRLHPLKLNDFRAQALEMLATVEVGEKGTRGTRQQMPKDISEAIFGGLWKHAPQTPDLIHAPIVAPDGTVISTPGWHRKEAGGDSPKSYNVLLDLGDLKLRPVSDDPSDEDCIEAKNIITKDLLGEFHFLDLKDGEPVGKKASLANATALILNPFLRAYIQGTSPMYLIEKTDNEAGASLLSMLPSRIVMGKPVSPTAYNGTEDEFDKVLTSCLLEHKYFLIFDNITVFGNRVMYAALTSEYLSGRQLGRSAIVERPNNFIWIATGINPTINGEMARRVCRVRLDLETDDKSTISYSKDLTKWVSDNRASIIWAALTLIRRWIARGAKKWSGKPLSSFEHWSEVLGGILEEAGIEGFMENRREEIAGSEDAALREFVKGIHNLIAGREVNLGDIRDHALKYTYEAVSGRDDTEKATHIRHLLNSIKGRAFTFDKKKVRLLIYRDQDRLERYKFEEVVKRDGK